VASLIFSSCSNSPTTDVEVGKPDLIIQNVTYSVIHTPREYDPGTTVRSGDNPPRGELTITLGNIGSADINETIYISWADDESDITKGHYPRGSRIDPAPALITAGGSLVFQRRTDVYTPGTIVKLFIPTDGKPHLKQSLPMIDEMNYENNTFELVIGSPD